MVLLNGVEKLEDPGYGGHGIMFKSDQEESICALRRVRLSESSGRMEKAVKI